MGLQEIVSYINDSIYVVNFFTIFTSVLSFVIFSRKAFSKSTIGFYCRSLAAFDIPVIINLSVGIASIAINNNRSLLRDIEWACKMMTYVVAVFSAMSGWILVFFSIDQLIAVSMTQRFGFFKKTWFQYSLILGLFAVHSSFYIPMIFAFSLVNKTSSENVTSTTCSTSSLAVPIIIFAEATLIPLIILIILTSVIGRYLTKSRRRITINSISHTTNDQQALSSTTNSTAHNRRAHEFKYAFNSIILNIMHIMLLTPLLVFNAIPLGNSDIYLILNVIAYLFYYLNNALHFWVHFSVNSIFRKEFLILIRVKNQ